MRANANRPRARRFAVSATTSLIVALSAACESKQEQVVDQIRAAVAAGPERTVAADEVAADYRRNPVDADATYKGHVFRMRVVVDEIVLDKDGVPFVGLRNGHGTSTPDVACTFNDNRNQVSGLAGGSEIVVRGFGAGIVAGTPVFLGCQIEQRSWAGTTDPAAAPAPAPPADPGVDAYEWNSKLEPTLNKAGMKPKLDWVGNGALQLESFDCAKVKTIVDGLGRTPRGYSVICTVPGGKVTDAIWRESNP